MRQLKTFIITFCTLILLFFCITNNAFCLLFLVILFIVLKKYIELKNILSNYNNITKKHYAVKENTLLTHCLTI